MTDPLPPRLAALQKAFGGIFETIRVTDAATGKQTVYRREDGDFKAANEPEKTEDTQ